MSHSGKPVDMVREFDKLVRDEIPQIIEADGETPETHVAGDEEYAERLVDKLEEEVAEYREDRRVAELADILEVCHTIREQKATERGRLEEQIVLDRIR